MGSRYRHKCCYLLHVLEEMASLRPESNPYSSFMNGTLGNLPGQSVVDPGYPKGGLMAHDHGKGEGVGARGVCAEALPLYNLLLPIH